jgi:hypothetical protein
VAMTLVGAVGAASPVSIVNNVNGKRSPIVTDDVCRVYFCGYDISWGS